MNIDLHMHSTASDGTMPPAALMQLAHQEGFSLVALTDHDTCSGIGEAARAAAEYGMDFLPGIELSCGGEKEIHVLGYGVDPESPQLEAFSSRREQERLDRAEQMLLKLREAGILIPMEDVLRNAGGMIGRPHIARAIVQLGYASSVQDAFRRYLVPGQCGYVPKAEVSVHEGCETILSAGGVPILAHPMELKSGEMALESLVHYWHSEGLMGMEVYHPSTANHKVHMLLSIARREQLLVTGGSDFHGPEVRNTILGQGCDRWDFKEDLLRLYEAMQKDCPTWLK